MALTKANLDEFQTFAAARLENGGADLCLEELAFEWQLLQERDDVNEVIRQGLADIEAGRGRPAREVTEELRKKYGFSAK